MRFYWAIVWALICNFLQASPISWPTANSRVGQNIYEACDSDLYIAEFLHPEHAYNCISTGARMFSPNPVDIGNSSSGSTEAIAMCSDEALLICLCGKGLGHCPSNYRVARYYVCSNPFEYPDSEPATEVYDGAFVAFITSSSPHDCSKPSDETKVDPTGGDSYGNSGTGTNDSDNSNDGGSSTNDGDAGGGDNTGGSGNEIDPSDYDCIETGTSSTLQSVAYDSCYSAKQSLYGASSTGTFVGYFNFDGSGESMKCYFSGSECSPNFQECSCHLTSSSYWLACVHYSGCCSSTDCSHKTDCYYGPFTQYPFGIIKNCSLSIPVPDGSTWVREFSTTSDCSSECQIYRDEYTSQYPATDDPQSPTDYENCEVTPNCNWVGAPMGFGICHCNDSNDSPTGNEGSAPTSRSGRSVGIGNDGNSKCGKGPDGINCEDTQKQVLSTVSELGENFENFSKDFKDFSKVPTNNAQNDLNSLGSQFKTEVNSQEFSDTILSDPTFLVWKGKFLEHIQTIRTEASQLAQSIVVEPPIPINSPYGCLEFDFSGQHFGPECLSEYLQPAIPYLSAFLEFLKYLLGFFILFRGKS